MCVARVNALGLRSDARDACQTLSDSLVQRLLTWLLVRLSLLNAAGLSQVTARSHKLRCILQVAKLSNRDASAKWGEHWCNTRVSHGDQPLVTEGECGLRSTSSAPHRRTCIGVNLLLTQVRGDSHGSWRSA